jgi:hypothetical protein
MTPATNTAANTTSTANTAPATDHVMSLALDGATIKQLDDLRRANPNVPNRREIIQRLIWDAHAKIASPAIN